MIEESQEAKVTNATQIPIRSKNDIFGEPVEFSPQYTRKQINFLRSEFEI